MLNVLNYSNEDRRAQAGEEDAPAVSRPPRGHGGDASGRCVNGRDLFNDRSAYSSQDDGRTIDPRANTGEPHSYAVHAATRRPNARAQQRSADPLPDQAPHPRHLSPSFLVFRSITPPPKLTRHATGCDFHICNYKNDLSMAKEWPQAKLLREYADAACRLQPKARYLVVPLSLF